MLSERQLRALLVLFDERMQVITSQYLTAMGEHIKNIGSLLPSDVHRLTEMRRSGLNTERIQREIVKSAEISVADLNTVFRAVAESNQQFAEQWFGSSRTPRVKGAPQLSTPIERSIKAQLRVTAQAFKNLSQTTIQSGAYQNAVDAAVSAVQSGVTDYTSAIRNAVREAGRDGLRVQYPSGVTRRLDTAVRQNVLDGVRSLNNDILQQLGKEYGADGIELSAHALCAEDHLPYQGRQFSDKDFEQLQNSLSRPFGQWNCRHTMFPIILGVSKPVHTPEELAAYARNSQELIEIDGRAKTRYEWTQEQRRIETAIRQQKDVANLAKACGDDTLRREAQSNINALQDRYAQISKAAGLAEQPQRTHVAGFRSVKTVEQLKNPPQSDIIQVAGQTINPKMRVQKQKQHIRGSKEFARRTEQALARNDPLPSAFYEGVDIYGLVRPHIGNCEADIDRHGVVSEYFNASENVGEVYLITSGTYMPSTRVCIRHSKDGWHAFPVKEVQNK